MSLLKSKERSKLPQSSNIACPVPHHPGRVVGRPLRFSHGRTVLLKVVPPAVATVERIAASIAGAGREEMFGRIAWRPNASTREALERVLEVQPSQSRSLLFRFREYPPEATPASLVDHLDRYRELKTLGVAGFDLSGTPPAVIEDLAQLTRRYDVQALKLFAPETRAAMLVCVLTNHLNRCSHRGGPRSENYLRPANRGEFRSGDAEEIMNKASC